MFNKKKFLLFISLVFLKGSFSIAKPSEIPNDKEIIKTLKDLAKTNKYYLIEARREKDNITYIKQEGKIVKNIKFNVFNMNALTTWSPIRSRYINLHDDEQTRQKLQKDVKEVLVSHGYTNPLVQVSVKQKNNFISYIVDIKKGTPCLISKIQMTFKNTTDIKLKIKEGDTCHISNIKDKIRDFEDKAKSLGFHKANVTFSHMEYSDDLREATLYLSGYLGSSFSYKVQETKSTGLLSQFLWFQYRSHPLDNLKSKYTTDQSVHHKIKDFYLNHGYNDVIISKPDRKTDKNGHIDIIYTATPGVHYKLEKINFIGNKSFGKNTLLNLNGKNYLTKTNFSYSEEEFDEYIEKLHAFYFSKGFWNAKVQKVTIPNKKTRKIQVSIRIKEGKKHLLNKLRIIGQTEIFEKELNLSHYLKEKKAISPDKVQLIEKKIKEVHRKKSFLSPVLSIEFDPQKSSTNHEFLDLIIKINSGKIYKTNNIYINGLETMSPDFVKKFLYFKENELYSLEKIEKSRQALLDLGVFDSVHFAKRDKNTSDKKNQYLNIYIDLRESKKGNVSFGPGYDLRSGFLYDLEVFYKNPFGKAHKFLVSSSISEEKNQPFISSSKEKKSHRVGTSIGFSHQNPFFFHKNLSQQITVLYKRGSFTDEGSSLWVTTKDFKLQFEYNLSFILDKASVFVNYHYLESLEEGKATNRISLLSIPDTTYSIFGVGFKIDKRDNHSLPQKGFYTELGIDLANTLFLGDYNYLKSKVLFSSYYSLIKNLVFAFHYSHDSYFLIQRKNHNGYEKFIPRAQRLFINTADKVRGFKTDLGAYSIKNKNNDTRQALGGTRSLVYKFELRLYKIYSIFGLTLFLDGGNTFFSSKESTEIREYYRNENLKDKSNQFEARDLDLSAGFIDFFKNPLEFIENQYHSAGLSINLALPIGVLNFSLSYPISEPRKTTWSRISNNPINNIKLDLNIGTTF